LTIPIFPPSSLPRLFLDPALVGLRFRPSIRSFQVEEIPLYRPSGEGEACYILLEKKGQNTAHLAKEIAQHLQIAESDIGYAGLKDRHATTTQWFSFPARALPRWESFVCEGVRCLEISKHPNKLRTGHLFGNRFLLSFRDLSDEQAEAMKEKIAQIALVGFPNFFGVQRFGHAEQNAQAGRSIFEGLKTIRSRQRQRLMISAYQSACFNDLLAWRIHEHPHWTEPLEGDLLRPFPRGGALRRFRSSPSLSQDDTVSLSQDDTLLAEEEDTTTPQEDTKTPMYRAYHDHEGMQEGWPVRRWVPTAILPGYKVERAEGLAGAWEEALWAREGLSEEILRRAGKMALGTRRLVAIWPWDTAVERREDGATLLRFSLPSGAYASVLLEQMGIAFGEEVKGRRSETLQDLPSEEDGASS
jgi:tRNA pseudouridine13 synthase